MVRGSNAKTERAVTATVRLRNVADAPVVTYFRRALLVFHVSGAQGKRTCRVQTEERHPARIGFTTLRPGRSVTATARLVELCPRGTFTKKGDYSVVAEYQTNADGADVGLRAFTGALRAKEPVSVHVRRTIELLEIHPVATPKTTAPKTTAPKTTAPPSPVPAARPPSKARVALPPRRQ